MGDVVLKKVANVLSNHTQEAEFVARFGGEEFILWYPNYKQSCVEDKLMTLLQEMKKITLDSKPVTVSIGACHFELNTGDTIGERMSALDKLIKVADECLYMAKQNGRDQFISRPYNHERLSL